MTAKRFRPPYPESQIIYPSGVKAPGISLIRPIPYPRRKIFAEAELNLG